MDLVRSIGADCAVDYTREDFTRLGRRFDLILDTAAHRSGLDYRRALAPNGVYVMVGGSSARLFQTMLVGPWVALTSGQRMRTLMSTPKPGDLRALREMIESGGVSPVIDSVYDGLGTVPDAIRHLERGHPRGKVVIVV